MSGFYGADTAQLREQAGACLRGSGTLRDLIGSTSALVGSVEWTGPDADAFRERWQSVVRARCRGQHGECDQSVRLILGPQDQAPS